MSSQTWMWNGRFEPHHQHHIWRESHFLSFNNIAHPLIANSVSRILALSSHSVPPLSVCGQAWHPTFAPLYDVLDQTNHIFSESSWSKDIKTDITKCLIHKYTNTQIQHVTECQKDQTCGIFLKKGLFRGTKNYIHMCQTHNYKNTNTQLHKYTNTAYDEVPERPNMWYIFEKRIVHGYQK